MFGASRTHAIGVVSIGSGSVSVGIAALRGRSFSLLASEKRVLPLEKRSSDQACALLKGSLVEAGHRAVAAFTALGSGRIDSLYCVIRAPWTHGEIARAAAAFPSDEYITRKIISDLARQTLPRKGAAPRFLDAAVIHVSLNGYRTERPEGQRARSVEVKALISSCEPVMRAVASDALAAVFPAQKPVWRSGTRASLEALMLAQPAMEDCVVLDVAEEGTTALVVRGGAADAEIFIPEGIRSILGRAAKNGGAQEVRTALRMIARDECGNDTCAAVQGSLAKIEPDLAHAFGEYFVKVGAPRRLPGALVLITQADMGAWLSHFFSRIDFTQCTLTTRPFEVAILSPSDLMPQPISRGLRAGPGAREADATAADVDIDLALALALINKETVAA